MISDTSIQKLKKVIGQSKSFVIVGHEKPDGDSVGSLLAFFNVLEQLQKNSMLVLKDPVPSVFAFLDKTELIGTEFPEDNLFDACILLDNGDAKRTGFLSRILEVKKNGIPVINIDHHPKNDLWKIATLNITDQSVSSTSELIFEIIGKIGLEIDSKLATTLLTGLYTDTGGFQHSNTSEKVLKIVAELLKRGAKLKKISENISGTHTISMLRLWGVALSRLIHNSRYKISYSILKQEDIIEAGATEDEVSGLVNLLNSAPESEVALLIYETENGKLRGSLRTESDKIDLSALAQYLGGGGHKKAAGFTIEGRIENEQGKWKII